MLILALLPDQPIRPRRIRNILLKLYYLKCVREKHIANGKELSQSGAPVTRKVKKLPKNTTFLFTFSGQWCLVSKSQPLNSEYFYKLLMHTGHDHGFFFGLIWVLVGDFETDQVYNTGCRIQTLCTYSLCCFYCENIVHIIVHDYAKDSGNDDNEDGETKSRVASA